MTIRDYITTAQGNLLRSKLRTALTIIAVFIGAFTLSLTMGIGSGARQYIKAQIGSLAAPHTLVVTKQVDFGQFTSSTVNEYDPEKSASFDSLQFVMGKEDINRIGGVEGVTEAIPDYPLEGAYVRYQDGTRYDLTVGAFLDGMSFNIEAGRLIQEDEQNGAIISMQYAEALGFTAPQDAVGKRVVLGFHDATRSAIHEYTATVVGVSQDSLFTGKLVMVSNDLAERVFETQTASPDQPKFFPSAFARFSPNASDDDITALKERLEEQGYTAKTVEDQIGEINTIINAISAGLSIFGAIALLAASFGIINTLFMSVYERTREIGIMRALGMSRRGIFTLFSLEAISIGFWGSLLGIGTSMAVGLVVNRVASNTFLSGLEGFNLFAFPLLASFGITALIVTISFLAGILPALRASRLNPISALRYE